MFDFVDQAILHKVIEFMHARAADAARSRAKDEAEAAEFGEYMREQAHHAHSHTIHDIGNYTGLDHQSIRASMKDAEGDFVHWRHPVHPDMTRIALREHVGASELRGWQPGTGF